MASTICAGPYRQVGPGKCNDTPVESPVDDMVNRPPGNIFAVAMLGAGASRSASTGVGQNALSTAEAASTSDVVDWRGETPGHRQGVLLERCRQGQPTLNPKP